MATKETGKTLINALIDATKAGKIQWNESEKAVDSYWLASRPEYGVGTIQLVRTPFIHCVTLFAHFDSGAVSFSENYHDGGVLAVLYDAVVNTFDAAIRESVDRLIQEELGG